jgi:hypothetical protein
MDKRIRQIIKEEAEKLLALNSAWETLEEAEATIAENLIEELEGIVWKNL